MAQVVGRVEIGNDGRYVNPSLKSIIRHLAAKLTDMPVDVRPIDFTEAREAYAEYMIKNMDSDIMGHCLELDRKQYSWDQYFIGMARYVATRSKDVSTRVGAVIVDSDNRVRCTGYNGFPSGVMETPDRTQDRAIRLTYSEHAERNAIYSAARSGVSTCGCTIYVSGLYPCAECARAIIQSGIKNVVVVSTVDRPERWAESMKAAELMFGEVQVTVRQCSSGPDSAGPDSDGPA